MGDDVFLFNRNLISTEGDEYTQKRQSVKHCYTIVKFIFNTHNISVNLDVKHRLTQHQHIKRPYCMNERTNIILFDGQYN